MIQIVYHFRLQKFNTITDCLNFKTLENKCYLYTLLFLPFKFYFLEFSLNILHFRITQVRKRKNRAPHPFSRKFFFFFDILRLVNSKGGKIFIVIFTLPWSLSLSSMQLVSCFVLQSFPPHPSSHRQLHWPSSWTHWPFDIPPQLSGQPSEKKIKLIQFNYW